MADLVSRQYFDWHLSLAFGGARLFGGGIGLGQEQGQSQREGDPERERRELGYFGLRTLANSQRLIDPHAWAGNQDAAARNTHEKIAPRSSRDDEVSSNPGRLGGPALGPLQKSCLASAPLTPHC